MKEKITILIADDNIDFTRTLSAYLEKMEDIEVVGIAKRMVMKLLKLLKEHIQTFYC